MANYTTDANMVSYWYMEQASGDNALDETANNNDLTAASDGSGPTQSATHKQGSYSADLDISAYERYTITDAALSAGFPGKDSGGGTGSFSIGGWFMLDEAAGVRDLIGKATDGEQMSYQLRINTTPRFYFFMSPSGWNEIGITGGTAVNVAGATWYHVVGVFDTSANYIYLYVNGASDATAVSCTSEVFLGTSDFQVGRFDGHVDEAFIMSRALSSTEVEEIYTYGLTGGPSGRTTKNTRAFPHGIFRGIRRMMGG